MSLTENKLEKILFFDGCPLNNGQISWVLSLQEKLGKEIAKTHPEIATEYKNLENLKSLYQLGEVYVSPEHSRELARHAVAYALNLLIPENELSEIQLARKRKTLEMHAGSFDSEEFIQRAKDAAKKRHQLYGVDVDAMLKARGRTQWSEAEKLLLKELIQNKEYQHQKGSHTGTPNYELIAIELNIKFHDCKEIRYRNSVDCCVRDMRRKRNNTETNETIQ